MRAKYLLERKKRITFKQINSRNKIDIIYSRYLVKTLNIQAIKSALKPHE